MGGSPRRPGRRWRKARQRAHRTAVRGQFRDLRHHCPRQLREAAAVAEHAKRPASRRGRRSRSLPAPARSGTSGMKTSTTASGPRASSTSPRRPSRNVQAFTDYGSTVTSNATGTHHLTLYRAPSGALVFGAGTVQWSWGLADVNAWDVGITDPAHNPPDPNMEQFTVNLLAEMGAQPATLTRGPDAGGRSRPTRRRRRPRSPRPRPVRPCRTEAPTTITGTASDGGGGVVAGRRSLDRQRRHLAPRDAHDPDAQTVSWSYTWAAHGYPATDDQIAGGGRQRATSRRRVRERTVKVSCPCSIWGNAVTPGTPDSGDAARRSRSASSSPLTAFGTITGSSLLQVGRQHRHPCRQPVELQRGPCWRRPRSATKRPPAGSRSTSPRRSTVFPNTTYVASVLRPRRPLRRLDRLLQHAARRPGGQILNSPPLHALGRQRHPSEGAFASANGVFSYGATAPSPSAASTAPTTGWTRSSPPLGPRSVTDVSATPDVSLGPPHLERRPPKADRSPNTRITPYIGTEAQAPSDRSPARPPADEHDRQRAQKRHHLHVHCPGAQPERRGGGLRGLGAVTPSTSNPPSAPWVSRPARLRARRWSAGANRRATAAARSPPTRSPRYAAASRPDPVEVAAGFGHLHDRQRPHQRHQLHVHRRSRQQRRQRRRVLEPVRGRHPAGHDLRLRHPDHDRRKRRLLRRARASSSTPKTAGTVTGIRFYKASTNTGTHVGSLWSGDRDAARVRDLQQRKHLRLAAGQLRQTGRDQRQHDLRRRLFRPQRPLLRHALRVHLAPSPTRR